MGCRPLSVAYLEWTACLSGDIEGFPCAACCRSDSAFGLQRMNCAVYTLLGMKLF